MLRKEIKDLIKAKIDALELEQNRLQTIDQKCVSTKSDANTYSTACWKVVYTCMEYQVPLTSIGPVVTANCIFYQTGSKGKIVVQWTQSTYC